MVPKDFTTIMDHAYLRPDKDGLGNASQCSLGDTESYAEHGPPEILRWQEMP